MVQAEFFLPFDLNELPVMDDDVNGPQSYVLEGMPKEFIYVVCVIFVEFHGPSSGESLKFLNPIKIEW